MLNMRLAAGAEAGACKVAIQHIHDSCPATTRAAVLQALQVKLAAAERADLVEFVNQLIAGGAQQE